MIQTATAKDGRRLTGYSSNNTHSLYDDDMNDNHHYYDDDVDDDDDDNHSGLDDEEEEDDSASILSIPDPNINFDLVYALHTFAATVDGQASVVKGDALTLLDDSNSYWWLVKVLKTSEVGYIPAENIETPYERLARLNSHRNIELTRRDIQDAFPAPPSAKSKVTKRVTLAKGVKFQAQVIFGASDNEDDFAEEYEEWDETLLSSDTDDSSSDSDDYDYYSSHLSGSEHLKHADGNDTRLNMRGQSGMSNNKAAHVPPIVTQSLDRRPSDHSIDSSPLSTRNSNGNSSKLGSRDTLDLEQSETIKISLTPSIARGGDLDDGYTSTNYNRSQQHQQKRTANKLERLLGEDDPLSSPTSPRNSGKKSSIRKFFSRGSKDSGSGKRKDSTSKASASGGESILSETASVSSQSTSYSERDRSGSLDSAMLLQSHNTPSSSDSGEPSINTNLYDNARYYTPSEGPNSMMSSPTSPASIMSPSSFTSYSSKFDQLQHPQDQQPQQQQSQQQGFYNHQHQQSHEQHPHELHSHQRQHQGEEPPTTLMIHGGNVAFGYDAKPTVAYSHTTALELIQQVVDSIDAGTDESLADRAMNYYLIVKGVDGDEYTLVPSDRPLSIYHSLTGHLNTPMPSLKKARRISQLMSTASDSTTHIGGPSSPLSPGNDTINTTVRFYLHSKKRTIHEEGVIRIKVSLLQSEIVDQDGLFTPGQTRVDKSLSVPHTGSVGEVAALILERFHLLNGVVAGSPDLNDQIKSLRLDGSSQNQVVFYRLNVFRNGLERHLDVNDAIIKAYDGESLPPIHYSRGSNPDRSSIASMSSVIHSPQADETFFILRRVHQTFQSTSGTQPLSSAEPPQRPARSHRPPVRQNTPMPHTKVLGDPGPVPAMHPLENYNEHDDAVRSISPANVLSTSPSQTISHIHHSSRSAANNLHINTDANKEQITPEDGDIVTGDVLMKLDAALDSLAYTRNSNEPLTEAITHHQQQQQEQQQQQRSMLKANNILMTNHRIPSPSSIASSSEQTMAQLNSMDDPPSTASTTSTMATTLSAVSDQSMSVSHSQFQDTTAANDNNTPKSPSRNRRGSIQSMIYWDDFGMDELMIMIRGTAKCQEALEKKEAEKKNRRSSRHYTAPIRSEISEVFKDCHIQLEQLEKELDMLMAQAVKTYG